MKSSIVHAFCKAVDNKGKQIGKQRKILGGSRNEITINLRFCFYLFNNLRIWLNRILWKEYVCISLSYDFWFLFFNISANCFLSKNVRFHLFLVVCKNYYILAIISVLQKIYCLLHAITTSASFLHSSTNARVDKCFYGTSNLYMANMHCLSYVPYKFGNIRL